MARRTTRKKKKKKSGGVWVGSAISGAIIIVIMGALFIKTRAKGVDSATRATSEANLVIKALPNDLPTFGKTTGGATVSTAELFNAVDKASTTLTAGGYQEEALKQSLPVLSALAKAAEGKPKPGFLDSKINDKQFDSPEASKTMSALRQAVSKHIEHHLEAFEFDQAQQIAVDYLLFNRHVFEQNVRLKARQRGLARMKSALKDMQRIVYAAREDGAYKEEKVEQIKADAKAWSDAIIEIEDVWNAKLKMTDTVNAQKGLPNIGDLIRIANDDKDRSFRIFAARRLGYALYERGDPGNQRAINKALDTLEQSDDAMIAAAAKGGRSIKDKDEYYELRK